MIIKGKDVIGLNIVTVDTGTIIETVDDIAYDPTNQRIVALLVDSGGLFSSAKAIHMDDVHNIGQDAVIVHDASVIKSIKELGDEVRSISEGNKHLVKTNVLTSEGKDLGKVTDIYFDSASGVVDSMEVSQGGLKNMTEGKKAIRPADIVTIGADATIVSTYTELKFEAQGQEGGLKGAFNDAKDKASEIAAETKEKATELAADAREKAGEIAAETRERTAKLTADAKETAQDIADKTAVKSKQVSEVAMQKADDIRDQVAEKSAEANKTIERKTRETRQAAAEAAEDIRARSKEFAADVQVKAGQVQREASKQYGELSDAAREEAEDLKQRAKATGKQAHAKAKDMAADAKRTADRVTDKTKEGIKNGSKDIKATARDTRGTNNHSGGKVVKETAQRYEDSDTVVESKKTVVKK